GARLAPSCSSASATSLWRISEPLTLASTGLASCACSGRPASSAKARQPVTAAEARPRRRPVFVSGNEVIMENPYPKMGCLAAGHSPNHVALATRKGCQNHEILDSFAPLTTLWPSHISAKPGQWRECLFRCAFGY